MTFSPRFLAAVAASLVPASSFAAPAGEPVLAELFTSQSCSSCPPAEANFRKLAARDDVVALEWHVDYWDRLSVGAAGRWKDPYSSPTHTARQRAYNEALRGTTGVYTPQAVLGGRFEAVGSHGDEINALIEKARRSPAPARLVADGAALKIDTAPANARARFVIFDRSTETAVGGGENKGARLASAHVVIETRAPKPARAGDVLTPPTLAAGQGCALLIEDAASGVALAARYCPG